MEGIMLAILEQHIVRKHPAKRSVWGPNVRRIVWTILITFPFIIDSPAQNHFRLEAGNTWDYYWNYDTSYRVHREIVGDSLLPDGMTYVVMQEIRSWQTDPPIITLFREDSAGVHEYLGGADYLFFDFSRTSPGVITIFPWNDTMHLRRISIDTVFGLTKKIYEFNTNWTGYRIADSLGLILLVDEPAQSQSIFGARINGEIYGGLTSVSQRATALPAAITLSQNYPNPFNPSTTIQYDLPRRSFIGLSVYDVLGRTVATIVNGIQEPRRREVKFDGSHLASGVYVYRLLAGSFVETKMMVLMK